jgi:hypothetical protein
VSLRDAWRKRREAARIATAGAPSSGIHLFDRRESSQGAADAYFDRAVQEGFEAELVPFTDGRGGGSWRVYVRRPGEIDPKFSDEEGWKPLRDLPES